MIDLFDDDDEPNDLVASERDWLIEFVVAAPEHVAGATTSANLAQFWSGLAALGDVVATQQDLPALLTGRDRGLHRGSIVRVFVLAPAGPETDEACHTLMADLTTGPPGPEVVVLRVSVAVGDANRLQRRLSPALASILRSYLAVARDSAAEPHRVAAWLRQPGHERLAGALTIWLADRLAPDPLPGSLVLPARLASLAADPPAMRLARLTIDLLQKAADDLYAPGDYVAEPEALLRQRFTTPPESKRIRAWVIARLHFFAGMSYWAVADHVALAPDTVKRVCHAVGPALVEAWIEAVVP